MKLTALQKHALRYLAALEPYSNCPQKRVINALIKKGLVNKDLSVTESGIAVLQKMQGSDEVVFVDFVAKKRIA